MNPGPGTWREPHRQIAFPYSQALGEWTEATIPVLEEVASRVGGYITYKDLAERLFDVTGVRTRMQLGNWIGKPLGAVLWHCHDHGLPGLSSLVVHTGDGMVGEGFNEFLRIKGRAPISDSVDLEWVAAEERLNCYRHYCPDVPAGAEPALTREFAQKIERKAPEPSAPAPACAGCGMQLPVSGQCDYCG
ncbi:hypothetical protein [Kocuria rosea]|uniref:hypothetical protein n=1 Tax=Kocuria rosea TaxID=1275 RepID=UPI000D65D7E4|nr:hypothetical protein [Kocuria rosea]PWF84870.1 hypothetical protein DEJ37_12590 [Kocuria rosea]STX04077.1 Uncharacterised protein [Kocuria rosea]